MKLYAAQGMRGTVIDLDTGKEVLKVIWLDPEKGQLEAYQVDERGEIVETREGYATYTAKGRFKFVPRPSAKPMGTKSVNMGAPYCAKCRSYLTLRGDDLCAPCRAKERGQKHSMKPVPYIVKRPHKCQSCSRQATWCVSDEVEVTPAKVRKPVIIKGYQVYLFDRAATVERRFYCDFCYKPPRIVDSKGEPILDLEHELRPL